ncbi:NDUFA12-domain-containing protein [Hysterangium stoloniferum]|nr:NDUFA12-domain-containing protein [Hysterangium stoloniferum]
MVSLIRTLRNIQRVGFREWVRQMRYIGDAKSGRYIGHDQFGNRYFENLNPAEEIPGRHRWVDYSQHEYNASQVPPEWHAWLSHIRKDPPAEDKVMQAVTPPWLAPYRENLTGTRGAFKTYDTVAPRVYSWKPQATSRS